MKVGLLKVASPDILTTFSNFASIPDIGGADLPLLKTVFSLKIKFNQPSPRNDTL
jgi:hypothetical protein